MQREGRPRPGSQDHLDTAPLLVPENQYHRWGLFMRELPPAYLPQKADRQSPRRQ